MANTELAVPVLHFAFAGVVWADCNDDDEKDDKEGRCQETEVSSKKMMKKIERSEGGCANVKGRDAPRGRWMRSRAGLGCARPWTGLAAAVFR